jgi:glutamate-1-semialdehyde 2,1-aminomutase
LEAYTSTGNPLAMAAGIETLDLLKSRKVYQDLGKKTVYLTEAISRSPEERGLPIAINQLFL